MFGGFPVMAASRRSRTGHARLEVGRRRACWLRWRQCSAYRRAFRLLMCSLVPRSASQSSRGNRSRSNQAADSWLPRCSHGRWCEIGAANSWTRSTRSSALKTSRSSTATSTSRSPTTTTPTPCGSTNGTGTFTDTGPTLDSNRTEGIALGDLDGDADLDIAFANNGSGNAIWLNDGVVTGKWRVGADQDRCRHRRGPEPARRHRCSPSQAVAARLDRETRNVVAMAPQTHPRHWTQPPVCQKGRPPTTVELHQLIVRLATENPTWGYRRIQGELATLGHTIARTTVWQILTNTGIDPSPNRSDVTWTGFLHSQAAVACDFFTSTPRSFAATTSCSSST